MSDIKGTTRAQSLFLRNARNHPHGPAPDAWPSAIVLRRWLRNPAFCAALQSLRDAHRFRADLQLASASSAAAKTLETSIHAETPLADDPLENRKSQLVNAAAILRLDYLRQRFSPTRPPTRPRRGKQRFDPSIHSLEDALKLLTRADPDKPVGLVCDFWLTQIDQFRKEQDAGSAEADRPTIAHGQDQPQIRVLREIRG